MVRWPKWMVWCVVAGLVASVLPSLAAEDIAAHGSCKYCGMNREMFAHSRMLIEYADGTTVATCSLRCTAVDLALNIDREPARIRVGDRSTTELIDAETATWVIGGSLPGVMTRNAKWAFGTREAAQAFAKENGGELGDFDAAIRAAYLDMYEDTQMIRMKREEKRRKMKMGNP